MALSVVDIVAVILIVGSVVFIVVLVIGMFIWGAVKDGQEDRAVQLRLGIRRRTRLRAYPGRSGRDLIVPLEVLGS